MTITAEPIIWINGQKSPSLDVADRGLAYGDGLFETMRFERGRVALLDLHMQRLMLGAHALAIEGVQPLVARVIGDALAELRALQSDTSYVIKLVVTRGVGGQGYRPAAEQPSPTVIVRVAPLAVDEAKLTNGVALKLCRWRLSLSPLLAGIKHLNRLEYVMAGRELAEEGESVQGLLTDANGSVVESLHHNVFIVKRGELITPQIAMSGVAGVMRTHILQSLAPALGIAASEGELRLDDLIGAEEILLCNSVQGVWPVVSFRSRELASGPITRGLQSQVELLWRSGHAG